MKYNFLCSIIIGFFGMNAAHAQTLPFIKWENLTAAQQVQLSHIRAATLAFDAALEGGIEACSGTYISNEGHILTAGHCVSTCLGNALEKKKPRLTAFSPDLQWITHNPGESRQIFDREAYGDYLDLGKPDDYFNIESFNVKDREGLECVFRINGNAVRVKYLGGSIGMLAPFLSQRLTSRGLLPDWKDYVAKGFGPGGDFAILKAEVSKTPCLPLSKVSVNSSEQLQVMSAPQVQDYKTADERRGQTAFYAAGQEATQELSIDRPELPLNVFRHAYIYSNYGSSGSGVVGSDGTVKGVLVQAQDKLKSDGTRFTFSSFIDAVFIKQILDSKWNVQVPTCDPNL